MQVARVAAVLATVIYASKASFYASSDDVPTNSFATTPASAMSCAPNFTTNVIENATVTGAHATLSVRRWSCTCSACLQNSKWDAACDVPEECARELYDEVTGQTSIFTRTSRYYEFRSYNLSAVSNSNRAETSDKMFELFEAHQSERLADIESAMHQQAVKRLGESGKSGMKASTGTPSEFELRCPGACCSCTLNATGARQFETHWKNGKQVEACATDPPNNDKYCTDFSIPNGCKMLSYGEMEAELGATFKESILSLLENKPQCKEDLKKSRNNAWVLPIGLFPTFGNNVTTGMWNIPMEGADVTIINQFNIKFHQRNNAMYWRAGSSAEWTLTNPDFPFRAFRSAFQVLICNTQVRGIFETQAPGTLGNMKKGWCCDEGTDAGHCAVTHAMLDAFLRNVTNTIRRNAAKKALRCGCENGQPNLQECWQLESGINPGYATGGKCAATHEALIGKIVETTTYTGSTALEKDTSCCQKCRDKPECEFWVRLIDTDTCNLLKGYITERQLWHNQHGCRGGFVRGAGAFERRATPWKPIPGMYCSGNYQADWATRTHKSLSDCQASCVASPNCKFITVGTHCMPCTLKAGATSYEFKSMAGSTTYEYDTTWAPPSGNNSTLCTRNSCCLSCDSGFSLGSNGTCEKTLSKTTASMVAEASGATDAVVAALPLS